VRRLLLLAFATLVSTDAGAQIIGRAGMQLQQPTAWASFSAAFVQGWSVSDGRTQSQWDFGDGTQYGVALEQSLSSGASVGVRGSFSRVPLRYSQLTGGSVSYQTDADANVTQLMALAHLASGRDLHTVLELGVGATLYSSFAARGSDVSIGPAKPDADFTFAFGYGIGYAFSRAFSIDVVQDLTTVLHQRTGLGAGDHSSVQIHDTRLVARLGLGGR
jgi:hypothetical protein